VIFARKISYDTAPSVVPGGQVMGVCMYLHFIMANRKGYSGIFIIIPESMKKGFIEVW